MTDRLEEIRASLERRYEGGDPVNLVFSRESVEFLLARLAACEQKNEDDAQTYLDAAKIHRERLAACKQERDTERSIRKETFARLARAEEALRQVEDDETLADIGYEHKQCIFRLQGIARDYFAETPE